MIVIEGKYGIKATILADSINAAGDRMATYELEYPRLILAELNTHRANPKNSHSSRAIPFNKMVEQLKGRPVRFGQANPGMQDKGEDFDAQVFGRLSAADAWEEAKGWATSWAKAFYEAGFHKQVYNRLTEPFQMMRTVLSGTEYDNFFWLRNDTAADPTLHELARVMLEARNASMPELLQPNEWHLPYVEIAYSSGGERRYYIAGDEIPLRDAIKVSAARCAAVSFRNEDYGLEKCLEVHARLVGDARKHASAFEHQCTPMQPGHYSLVGQGINITNLPDTWEEGISHMDRQGNLWSGPLKGFVQYRKLIPGECFNGAAAT